MANRRGNMESQRNGGASQCFVCKTKCENTCSRCGEFYCSKQCQIADWRDHKYYCFEMPALNMNSTPSNGSISDNSPRFQNNHRGMLDKLRRGEHQVQQPNSSENGQAAKATYKFADYPNNHDDVVLTHVRYANLYYIRTCSSEGEYKKNEKDFNDYGKRAPKLPALPQKNDIVLVRTNNQFYRALVLNVHSEDRIEVGLLDSGKKIDRSIHELRQLSDELKSRERYNFRVQISNLPNKLEKEKFNKLLDFVRNGTVFKIQFDGADWGSSQKFKLIEKDSGLPIDTLIMRDGTNQLNGSKSDNSAKSTETDRESPIEALRDESSICTARSDTPPTPLNNKNTSTEEAIPSPNVAVEVVNELHTPMYLTDLTAESLPEVATLIILDDETIQVGYVSAIEAKNIGKLDDLHKKAQGIGDKDVEIYEPMPDELCLVKFNEEWYRAINCASKYLLIDWGNLEDIDRRDVRKFPGELTDPCFTFVCNIDGMTPEMARDEVKVGEIKKRLKTKENHSDCTCTKSEDEPMEYFVKFPILSNYF